MSLPNRLKQLREEHGMLQKDLAKLLGCSPKTVSGYERAEREPNIATLDKYAEIFGVTIGEILGEDYSLSDLEKEFPEVIQSLRKAKKNMSPEAKKIMNKMLLAILEDK